MIHFVFCNTQELLDSVVCSLAASVRIFLDCEGRSLGNQGGKLSLICLGTSKGDDKGLEQIFVIDALALSKSVLEPLFAVLRAATPPKIVYDGRKDFSELFHGYGVELNGVLDLQLADIVSRFQRGEGDYEQVRRLWNYIGPAPIRRARQNYKMVHRISGLKGAVTEHRVATAEGPSVSHEEWLQRPLPSTLLEYAAKDIELIQKLYVRFRQLGYIDEPRLLEQSQRYMTIYREKRPSRGDRFKQHALLPLGIIEPGSSTKFLCQLCKRELAQECFPPIAVQNEGERQCWVCRALRDKETG